MCAEPFCLFPRFAPVLGPFKSVLKGLGKARRAKHIFSGEKMKKGFTLIELLVVVLIIGILSSVALPQYTKAVNKSRGTEAMVAAKALTEAENIYYLSNDKYTSDFSALDIEIPELKNFTLGSGWPDAWSDDRGGSVNVVSKKGEASLSYHLSSGKMSSYACFGSDCSSYFSCTPRVGSSICLF